MSATKTSRARSMPTSSPPLLRSLRTPPTPRVTMNWLLPPVGVRRMMEGITGLATPELERDVQQFIKDRQVDLGGKIIQQYLEQLRIVVRLRERESAALHESLR